MPEPHHWNTGTKSHIETVQFITSEPHACRCRLALAPAAQVSYNAAISAAAVKGKVKASHSVNP